MTPAVSCELVTVDPCLACPCQSCFSPVSAPADWSTAPFRNHMQRPQECVCKPDPSPSQAVGELSLESSLLTPHVVQHRQGIARFWENEAGSLDLPVEPTACPSQASKASKRLWAEPSLTWRFQACCKRVLRSRSGQTCLWCRVCWS